MIIAFFRLFFKDEKCRQKHAEFRNELCVFLFALSIGRFRWMLKNILMRICLLPVLFADYLSYSGAFEVNIYLPAARVFSVPSVSLSSAVVPSGISNS